MASKETMTTATSTSGVTTEQDSGDSGSSLESLMKLKSDAEVLLEHAKGLVETTGRVWVQAAKTAEQAAKTAEKAKQDVDMAWTERDNAWKELCDINKKIEVAQVTQNKKRKSDDMESMGPNSEKNNIQNI